MEKQQYRINQSQQLLNVMDDLIENSYTQLFDQLNLIHESLMDLKEKVKVEILLAIQDTLNIKLEELYRREKLVLFPFLRNYIQNPSNQQNPIPPIQLVHQQGKGILTEVNSFKEHLFQYIADNKDYEELNQLSNAIHIFESDLKIMLNDKFHNLFTHLGFEA